VKVDRVGSVLVRSRRRLFLAVVYRTRFSEIDLVRHWVHRGGNNVVSR